MQRLSSGRVLVFQQLRFVWIAFSLLVQPPLAVADGSYPCGVQRLPPKVLKTVQESLRQLGFDPGRSDGVYSRQTKTALMAYARKRDDAAGTDENSVYSLLGEALGPDKADAILPPPPDDLTRKHNGLECSW